MYDESSACSPPAASPANHRTDYGNYGFLRYDLDVILVLYNI